MIQPGVEVDLALYKPALIPRQTIQMEAQHTMLGAAAKTFSHWREAIFARVALRISNIKSPAPAKAHKIRNRPLSPMFRLEINSPPVFNNLQKF